MSINIPKKGLEVVPGMTVIISSDTEPTQQVIDELVAMGINSANILWRDTSGVQSDTTAPTMTAFSIEASSENLNISILSLSATDAVGVTGYLITESASTPSANDPDWASASSWTTNGYTPSGYGTDITLYAWAKDAAGNISTSLSDTCTHTNAAPTFSAQPSESSKTTTTVTVAYGTADDEGDHYKLEGKVDSGSWIELVADEAPGSGKTHQFTGLTASTQYTFQLRIIQLEGDHAAVTSNTVQITTSAESDVTAPTMTAFDVAATASALNIPISSLSATDAVGVTGYLITTSSTPPSPDSGAWASASSWISSGFDSAVYGNITLYAWAKDAAGNVSSYLSDTCNLNNAAPTFSTQPALSSKTHNTVTIGYGTSDTEGDHYTIEGRVDAGSWTLISSDETPGSGKTYQFTGLTPGTSYTFQLRITQNAGNHSTVTSNATESISTYDTTATQFTFTDITDATQSTLYTSNSITILGIDSGYPISISVTGGEYDKNGSESWTSSPGTVVLNDTVRVRQTSSSSGSTQTNCVLTVGATQGTSVSDTYSVTTAAGATEATFYATTGDGFVEISVQDGAWSTVRSAAAGTLVDTSDTYFPPIVMASYMNFYDPEYWTQVQRAFLYFDTSSLAGKTITSAVLHFNVTALTGSNSVVAMVGTQGSPLSEADFDAFTGSSRGSVAVSSTGAKTITLTGNLSDDSLINRSGVTKICLLEGDHDYNNSSPNSGSVHSVTLQSREGGGDSTGPKLVITYTD